jgi:hypothetical protein
LKIENNRKEIVVRRHNLLSLRSVATLSAAALLGTALLSGDAFAKGKPPTPGGETGTNNLSFPVIFSENVAPAAFPADGAWRFAPIDDPVADCIGEEGVTPGTPVPPDYLCYYGRHVTVVSETGEIRFDGDPCPSVDCKVWWLQKRTQNFWKTLSVGHDVSTPLVVSAVDIGDLLESSPSIQARQIRVEFNLLQNVPEDDTELGGYVVTDWTNPVPSPCADPTTTGQSVGCFAAFGMSGAVPGTEQSGNEMQGNDFGPGAGTYPGTQTLLDPATVRQTTPDVGGIEALVYSRCARLLIQKIGVNPTWNPNLGQWNDAGAPLVNIAAYTNAWSTEITSGGSIVYGYNWNAKTASTGTYRLTFVLDGNDTQGPVCSTQLATKFERSGTTLVNVGENNPGNIVYAGESGLGDEGGLAYIDLTLTTKGGGGKGGGNGGGNPNRP